MRTSALLLVLLLVNAGQGTAQGCSQCREAVGQTPPVVQRAYRRGIVVLAFAGCGLFAGTLLAVRRFR